MDEKQSGCMDYCLKLQVVATDQQQNDTVNQSDHSNNKTRGNRKRNTYIAQDSLVDLNISETLLEQTDTDGSVATL